MASGFLQGRKIICQWIIRPREPYWATCRFRRRDEVDQAALAAAAKAFEDLATGASPPPGAVPISSSRDLLDTHREELAQIITQECGKTLAESKGELRRAIENVEVACGIPMMMQGTVLEDIASGIDELMIRQPLGVAAAIAPFNFPAMIPFWFMPYALACGNTYIVKPSEKVPLTMQRIFELLDQAGFPPGVVNLVNGAKATVDAILEHPTIRAVSFVGSSPVAKLHLRSGLGPRQAGAVPGRREKSRYRATRRRPGHDHPHCGG
jgi:malonate-semialdehyde dehydrogenase (acetylating)/methylmalonate-semialdehyde dehydrogenase